MDQRQNASNQARVFVCRAKGVMEASGSGAHHLLGEFGRQGAEDCDPNRCGEPQDEEDELHGCC
jgi:hypothetical protein